MKIGRHHPADEIEILSEDFSQSQDSFQKSLIDSTSTSSPNLSFSQLMTYQN
jgi:hypothetical protein